MILDNSPRQRDRPELRASPGYVEFKASQNYIERSYLYKESKQEGKQKRKPLNMYVDVAEYKPLHYNFYMASTVLYVLLHHTYKWFCDERDPRIYTQKFKIFKNTFRKLGV